MRRILVVETGAGFGGALTSLETLLARVDSNRFGVHLVTSYPQALIKATGAVRRVEVIGRNRRYGPGSRLEKGLRPLFGARAGNVAFVIDQLTTGRNFARRLARYVQENDVDILQGNNGILINDAVILAARLSGRPCVIHSRGAEYPGRVGRWLAKGVSRVLAVSEYVAETVRALGVAGERIVSLPEGLDADGFASRADPQAFRASHGLPGGVPLVGMVACLVPWKGQEVFLEACAHALSQTAFKALIVGAEPGGSGEVLDALRAKARSLGIEEAVRFTGYESGVASVMAACDVVVHASTSPEPFGRVLLEAMALGRPVIATRAGGPMEVVDHGQDGLLVTPGDALAMSGAIGCLLGDARLRESLGRAGWDKVRRLYGIEGHVAKVQAVWNDLAG
jgi:glycosyltransferase involved in cell wall biosynthesis